jgi:uncharacterized membrane protein
MINFNTYKDIAHIITSIIDITAILLITVSVVVSIFNYIKRSIKKEAGIYKKWRLELGHSLQASLELLIAGDIIQTIASELTISNISILGLLVAVRTILSWSIEVEISGSWPWQRNAMPIEETDKNRIGGK